jgi:hypothetical protein
LGQAAGNENGGLTSRTAGSISWSSGFANASLIKFEAESKNGDIEYKSTIRERIDLFSPISTVGNILIPAGTYKEIEFKTLLTPFSGEPALELRGSYNATPLVVRINHPVEFKAEKEDVTITDNNGYNAITTLNLNNLIRGISDSALANAVRTNGEIIISPSVNTNIYNRIIQNLDDSEDFEWDDD